MLDLPQVVRNKAAAADAAEWLDELPQTIADLAGRWSFRAGRLLPGGTESVVIEVELDHGGPAVLKLLIPRDAMAARCEITALRLASGEGCVRMLDADEGRGAILLERLGRSLGALGHPIVQRHEILVTTVARMWRQAPGADLPTGATKADWLSRFITATWAELERPCSEQVIDDALSCAQRRREAHEDARAVLVHGDVHQANALEADDGFRLIDPDGLLAEPEYDLGILMREDPVELMRGDPWTRAHRLAELSGLDATAIWEWGVVERVSTGLLCTKVDLQPIGRQMLAAAEMIAG